MKKLQDFISKEERLGYFDRGENNLIEDLGSILKKSGFELGKGALYGAVYSAVLASVLYAGSTRADDNEQGYSIPSKATAATVSVDNDKLQSLLAKEIPLLALNTEEKNITDFLNQLNKERKNALEHKDTDRSQPEINALIGNVIKKEGEKEGAYDL